MPSYSNAPAPIVCDLDDRGARLVRKLPRLRIPPLRVEAGAPEHETCKGMVGVESDESVAADDLALSIGDG
ncbi:MAG: hypothetical protein H0U46_05165 [Actinobacteria bacterium]|nr:hypothetical protein [Actinomycetota bacterium]